MSTAQATTTTTTSTTVSAEPPRRSPYSARAKVGRVLWSIVRATVWALVPNACHGVRRTILRLFGATIGTNVQIHKSVSIEIPWNLALDDGVRVDQRANLYCLGPVEVGANSWVGPGVHLCAGTHDYTSPSFTLLRQPIWIGQRCALLTDSFVAPGVRLAEGTVLRPRAAAFKDTEPDTVYAGTPAKVVGPVGEVEP